MIARDDGETKEAGDLPALTPAHGLQRTGDTIANAPPRVLLVEDDPILATLVRETLSDHGFHVDVLEDGHGVADWVRKHHPDAVLLDLVLPGQDGFSICRELRSFSTVPLIMVTSRAEADDRLQGLDIGADDYVCKPFLPGELAARLRALLRRSGNWRAAPTPPAPVLSIDVAAMQASIRGVTLALTPVEFRLLQTLAQHEGRVYSRAQLLDAIYASSHVINDRTVDSHIKNLRRKIVDAGGDDPLLPVYGVGYKFQWPKQR